MQNNILDMMLPESNMADGGHLEFPLSLPLYRCPPCFKLKLRDPFTHFKRENLCLKKCIRGPEPETVFPILGWVFSVTKVTRFRLDEINDLRFLHK